MLRVVIICVVITAAAGLIPFAGRPPTRRRVVAAAVGVPAAGCLWFQDRFERRLGDAATTVFDQPLGVHCRSWVTTHFIDGGNAREVKFTHIDGELVPGRAKLDPALCSTLRRFISDPTRNDLDTAVAVQVLTHEAVHVTGILGKGLAECVAMEHSAQLTVELGASPAHAAAMTDRYRTEVHPRMPAQYRSEKCKSGL